MMSIGLMAVGIFIFIMIFSEAAIHYEIRNEGIFRLKQIGRNVVIENGNVRIKHYKQRKTGMQIVIYDMDGNLLYGNWLEGLEIKQDMSGKKLIQVSHEGKRYYVIQRRKRLKDGQRILIRGYINKKEVSSKYLTLKKIAYSSLIFGVLAILFFIYYHVRKLSVSLNELKKESEKIGTFADGFDRMEYNGQFLELEVLTQAQNRMISRMEENYKQQEQFNSDVAHELRTPLTVILAECEYAKEQTGDEEEMKEFVTVVARQGMKMKEMVQKLLQLSRLERGTHKMHLEETDLSIVAESLIEELEQINEKNITFSMELNAAVLTGDVSLLSIAIKNILENAVKFSDREGEIQVVTGENEKGCYVIVRDFGEGIPKEELKHIFERFYKKDSSRNGSGYGLGLSLTKKILEMHHGKIDMESESGYGTTVTITF